MFQGGSFSLKGISHGNPTYQTAKKKCLWLKKGSALYYWFFLLALCMQLLQLGLTLCYPMDCSLPGSSVYGILQARRLEWWPCPPRGDLPQPGIKLASLSTLAWRVGSLPLAPPGMPLLPLHAPLQGPWGPRELSLKISELRFPSSSGLTSWHSVTSTSSPCWFWGQNHDRTILPQRRKIEKQL